MEDVVDTLASLGVPEVVATRWQIDSASAVPMMDAFYRGLANGLTVPRPSQQRGSLWSAMPDTGTPTTGPRTTPPGWEQPICARSSMATATSTPTAASQLDVVFDGTWILAPSVDANGLIIGVDIYSPDCGHPHGAYFTNQLNPNPWPLPAVFYMLDAHSHLVAIRRASGSGAGMNITGIDQTINHCVTKIRPLGGAWDLMISIPAAPIPGFPATP